MAADVSQMSILSEIVDAIKRHPHINRIIVSAQELEEMREEYVDLLPGGRLPEEDRRMWLSMARQIGTFHIMGRLVEKAA